MSEDSNLWLQTVLEQGGSFAGINRKVQVKPLKWSQPEEGSKEEPRCTEALLILKHGGVLTHAGRQQVHTPHCICISCVAVPAVQYASPSTHVVAGDSMHVPYPLPFAHDLQQKIEAVM